MIKRLLLVLFLSQSCLLAQQTMTVTAYTSSRLSAFNLKLQPGIAVAANKSIPAGTRIYIEGLGWRIVQDRMPSKYGSNALDVYFSTKKEAIKFGRKKLKVWIYASR